MAVKTIIHRIGSYLRGAQQSGLAASPAPPEPPVARLPGSSPAPSRVQPAANPASHMPAGCMQLIGLSQIQQALGDAWPARAEQIYRMVDAVLQRRLERTDAFYKVDTENYLILFTRLGRKEAEFKARVISKEIQQQVFGELLPDHEVTVFSAVADVDRKMVLEKTSSLQDLLSYVRATSLAENGVTMFADGSKPSSAPSAAAVVGAGPDMADLDQPLTGLFHRKTVAIFLKECQAGFHPTFSLRRRSFASYQTSILHMPSGKPADRVNDPFLEKPEELPFQLDRFALTAGLLGAQRMLTSGRQGIVIIPVRFDTLAVSRLREIYFARLKEVPAGVSRFIGISLRDIPAGTPASRVAEALSYIQPFCHTRLLRVPADARQIEQYADAGCHGFSTWWPQDMPDTGKIFQALQAFTKRAALNRMESILTDIASQDELSTAITAGFTYLSGDAIAGTIETPGFTEHVRLDHMPRPGSAQPTP